MHGQTGRRHFFTIDVVRFLAAMSVAYYHLGFKAFANPDDPFYLRIGHHIKTGSGFNLAAMGWIGVQVFFVISGFVIAYSMRGEGIGVYARRRFTRLVPAVWIIAPICAIIAILYFHEPAGADLTRTIRTLSFLPVGPWIMGQFWTLPVEISFYIAIAALIGLRCTMWVEPFAWILGLVSVTYWIADAAFKFGSGGQHLIQLLLIQHGVFFGIGITIYKAGSEGLTGPRIGFLALSCVPAFLQISWASQWEAIGMDPTIRSAVAFAIWLVLTGLILVGALRKSDDAPPQPTLAATIKLMGATTYPLYLLHFHIGGAVLVLFMERGARPTVAITAALLVSLLAAVAIAKLAEPATRTFLDRLIGGIFPSTIQQLANPKTGGPAATARGHSPTP